MRRLPTERPNARVMGLIPGIRGGRWNAGRRNADDFQRPLGMLRNGLSLIAEHGARQAWGEMPWFPGGEPARIAAPGF